MTILQDQTFFTMAYNNVSDSCKFPVQVETDGPGSFELVPTSIYQKSSYICVPSTSKKVDTSSSRLGDPKAYLQHPRHPSYSESNQRLASFTNSKWTTTNKPAIETFVACGLFFTGIADLVRCFFCGIGLKDWSQDDDVKEEHMKHSSNCGFLHKLYGKEAVQHMKIELTCPEMNNKGTDSCGKGNQPIGQEKKAIRSPQYETLQARLQTFTRFPKGCDIKQKALAGLFYTGKDDLCRCFTCNGDLQNWTENDDAFFKHARNFPNCSYIIHVKGKEFVERASKTSVAAKNSMKNGQAMASSQPSSCVLETANTGLEYTQYQIIQKLGYNDKDVLAALELLQKQGKHGDSVEDIVNAILDLQESQ